MKVLLLTAPDINRLEPFRSSPRRQLPMLPGFPLGLGYLAAWLAHVGHDPWMYDSIKLQADFPDILDYIRLAGPDVIGISAYTVNSKATVELARRIRTRYLDIILVAGGPHVSTDYLNLQKNYPVFDYLITGEAEYAFAHLLQSLDPSHPSCSLHPWHPSHPSRLIHALPIPDLDVLPFPARHLVDFNSYIHKESILPYQVEIMTSRGCTHRCAFCSFQKKWRPRSVSSVIAEMQSLLLSYPRIRSFAFHDDNFSADKNRVLQLCQAILSEGLHRYPWSCSCRTDQIDEEMLRSMKKAGCAKILFGLESANPAILQRLNKHLDLADAQRKIFLADKIGIPVIVFVIAGSPGETRQTLRNTYHFVKHLPCPAVAWSIMQVYPGTRLSRTMPHPLKDFTAYLYQPELSQPSGMINANIIAYENPGLDRETLKKLAKRLALKTILWKMLQHPAYAFRKFLNMPYTAAKNFLFLLGLRHEPF